MGAIAGLVERVKKAMPRIVERPVEIVSIDVNTPDEEMNKWGVERTEDGFDTSALTSQLYEATKDRFGGRFYQAVSRSGVEFYRFPRGDWIHSEFALKRHIEAHFFRVDANDEDLTAYLSTRADPKEAREIMLARLGRIPVPFNEGVDIDYMESGESASSHRLSPRNLVFLLITGHLRLDRLTVMIWEMFFLRLVLG